MQYQDAAAMDAAKLYAELKTAASGLAPEEAAVRLAQAGPNSVPRPPRRGAAIFWRQLKTPMALVMLAAFAISLAVSDPISAFTVLAFLLMNAALGFVQEYRSENLSRKLEKFAAPFARVCRSGRWQKVPRSEVVPGDLVAFEAGDAFPADCRIIKADNLAVDESALTGESAPAAKDADPAAGKIGSQAPPCVGLAGTIVISGEGEGLAVATGKDTVFGRLAAKSEEVKKPSAFERDIYAFSRFLVWLVIAVLGAVFAVNLLVKGPEAQPIALLLFSLAVAVSVVPEALPAVMTVTFTKGALALAKKKVVVKRLSAIEDLGQIEVLCTDKTGTITENRLSVGRVSCGEANACMLAALHASPPPGNGEQAVSSFDSAVWSFAGAGLRSRAQGAEELFFLPFDPSRRRNAVVVKRDGTLRLSIKGAPEDVLGLCGVSGSEREKALAEFKAMGNEGMRVLAVAEKEVAQKEEYGPEDEAGARFLGLIGFADPLKPTAAKAIAQAEKLNVRVKIITGDSLEVGAAVGMKIGIIPSPAGAVSGAELAALDEPAFMAAVERYDVFARIAPEMKYRIVSALERKFTVGFLGEGVNDAPALKASNVAIAVAEASDVAREASDVILLERSLAAVVDGIREGRAIFANVNKFIRYTLVGNLGNFFSIALISLFVDYLPLLPVQILLINLLSDVPFVSVAADSVDDEDVAFPRHFSVRGLALYASILGFVASLFDFIFFAVFRHGDPAAVRTLWFIDNMLTETATVFVLRTDRFFLAAKRPAWLLSALAAAVMAVSVALPFTALGSSVFGFAPPRWQGLAAVGAIAVSYVLFTEAAKIFYVRFARVARPEEG